MREVIQQAENSIGKSETALEMYAYRIKKYIGAYTVALQQVDAIVFTGGIGEHAVKIREMVCEGLEDSIGAKLDKDKNCKKATDSRSIHHTDSRIKLLVIPTNEELEIARQTEEIITENGTSLQKRES
jgi:acetate kinase